MFQPLGSVQEVYASVTENIAHLFTIRQCALSPHPTINAQFSVTPKPKPSGVFQKVGRNSYLKTGTFSC